MWLSSFFIITFVSFAVYMLIFKYWINVDTMNKHTINKFVPEQF